MQTSALVKYGGSLREREVEFSGIDEKRRVGCVLKLPYLPRDVGQGFHG
jgi:hypothetical protein